MRVLSYFNNLNFLNKQLHLFISTTSFLINQISTIVNFNLYFFGFVIYKNLNFTLLTLLNTKFRFLLLSIELFKDFKIKT